MTFPPIQAYGPSHSPLPSDVEQGALDNCGLLSTMVSEAQQKPQAILQSFRHEPEGDTYLVTLFTPAPLKDGHQQVLEVTVRVTQEDLADNLARRGGSAIDDNADHSGAAWPAIRETAVAKWLDGQPADGLDVGYARMNLISQVESLRLLEGRDIDERRSIVPGVLPALPALPNAQQVHHDIAAALEEGKTVTVTTSVQGSKWDRFWAHALPWKDAPLPLDGLRDHHGYAVVGTHTGEHGELLLDLHDTTRKPFKGEGSVASGPITTVTADRLLDAKDAVFVSGEEIPREYVPPVSSRYRREDF
jgi:hypothetical protein